MSPRRAAVAASTVPARRPAKTSVVSTNRRRPAATAPAAPAAPAAVVGGTPAQERNLRSQGKQTLRRLLDAALVVFDKRGYHGARVDDIVKVAKTSHGTFYLYFSSKEDLFRALVGDVTQEMMALSESLPQIAPGKSGWRELRAWLEHFYDLYVHYHPVIHAWMESQVGNIDLGRMGASVLVGFMHRLVERVEELHPAGTDARVAALAMVAMVERMCFYSVIQIVPLDRDTMLDTTATLLQNGLLGARRRR